MIHNILSIAGSDPSGGAGIQADLKTFSALGCYGMAVVTALTAQNTREVVSVETLPRQFILDQVRAVASDIGVDAVKIGMLFDEPTIAAVAEALDLVAEAPVVVDPVMVAASARTSSPPIAIQYPPDAATSPIDTTTGLPAPRRRTTAPEASPALG